MNLTEDIMMRTQHTKYDTRGQWAVFSHFGGQLSLHARGNESIYATSEDDKLSARRLLDERSRAVLFDALRHTVASGESVSTQQEHAGDDYQVIVRPILTPDSSMIIGAIAVFDYDRAVLPAEPRIGTWQWNVGPDGKNYGDNASIWNDDLYRLHEYQPDTVSNERGPAGEWLNKLVPPAEQQHVTDFVNKGLTACNNRALVLSMGAITRPGSSNPGRKQLELIGTAMPHPDHAGVRFAYGFTREVPRSGRSLPAGYETIPTSEVIRAYFEVASKLALAAVDCQIGVTFQRSPGWSAFGLHPEFDGDFAALVPEDERQELLAYFDRARASDAAGRQPHHAAVRLLDGTDRSVSITAVRVDRDAEISRYLLLALDPA